MNTAKKLLLMMGGGGSAPITGFASMEMGNGGVFILAEATDGIRGTEHYWDGVSSTIDMLYMHGSGTSSAPLSRIGLKRATAPLNDPQNKTIQSGYLLESEIGNQDNIDGGSLVYISSSDNLACVYGDYNDAAIFLATKSGATLGTFTKQGTIADYTASSGQWYQYVRHVKVSKANSGRTYIYFEAREGANEGSGLIARRIGRIYTDDDPSDIGATWSAPEIIFERSQFAETSHLSYQDFWMPSKPVQVQGGRWIMFMLITHQDFRSSGFVYAYSDDDQATWTMAMTNYWIFDFQQSQTTSFGFNVQEPDHWVHPITGVQYVNFNGSNNTEYRLGYATLTAGEFTDALPADLVEEDCSSLANFTATNSNGISSATQYGKIVITSDGSENNATSERLRVNDTFKSVSNAEWSMCFDYLRNTNSGGECRIGIRNAAGTNKAYFAKGSTRRELTMVIDIGGVNVYSRTFVYGLGNLKVRRSGKLMTFWERKLNTSDTWVNVTNNGGSFFGDSFVDVSSWGEEDVYPFVEVENVSGSAFTVTLNDIVVKGYDHKWLEFWRPSDIAQEWTDQFQGTHASATAGEIARVLSFWQSLRTNGWDRNIDNVFLFNLGSDRAISLKGKVGTNNGATETANGYDFDGTDDYFATGINLSTEPRAYSTLAMYFEYIHTIGNQTVARYHCDADDATNVTRLIRSGGNKQFGINRGSANLRSSSGNFSSDQFVVALRSGSGAGNENLYINGVLQSVSSGAASVAIPNDVLDIGRKRDNTLFFDGLLGCVGIGSPSTLIADDQVTLNTIFRTLLGV